jgi:hypothetical protein
MSELQIHGHMQHSNIKVITFRNVALIRPSSKHIKLTAVNRLFGDVKLGHVTSRESKEELSGNIHMVTNKTLDNGHVSVNT